MSTITVSQEALDALELLRNKILFPSPYGNNGLHELTVRDLLILNLLEMSNKDMYNALSPVTQIKLEACQCEDCKQERGPYGCSIDEQGLVGDSDCWLTSAEYMSRPTDRAHILIQPGEATT